jgi:hypothetical protein
VFGKIGSSKLGLREKKITKSYGNPWYISRQDHVWIFIIRNIPLNIISVDKDGKTVYNKAIVLEEREKDFELDMNKSFKLNSGSTGFCEYRFKLCASGFNTLFNTERVLYTPECLAKVAGEVAKPDGQTIFSPDDRIGLVNDMFALSKAGLAKVSCYLTLVDKLKHEKECRYTYLFVKSFDLTEYFRPRFV